MNHLYDTADSQVQPDSLTLTQADLDRGLTAEQIDWLRTRLNIKPLARALRDIECRKAEEGQGYDALSSCA